MRFLAVAAILSFATFAQAELPPGSYNKLRADAEEALTIQVTDIARNSDNQVYVSAKVLGVERSKSGLKKGDSIRLKYSPAKPKVGPAPPPIPEKDGVYPAFLNKKGDDFEPAAHGSSFKMTPEVTDAKAEKIGKGFLTVEEFMKLSPTDPKMEKLRQEVVRIGQGGNGMYRWVQSRLRDETDTLESWIRDTKPKPEEEKELRAKIEYLVKVMVEIDAPR